MSGTQLIAPEVEPPITLLSESLWRERSEDPLADPLQTTRRSSQTQDAAAPDPRDDPRLPGIQDRLARVADPVAFMTTSSYSTAATDRDGEAGFYEQSKAESLAIAADLRAIHPVAFLTMAAAAESLADMYAALQAAGQDEAGLLKAQEAHRAAVDAMDLSGALLGEGGHARIQATLGEVGLFLRTWAHLKETSGSTNASSQMWKAFLQTVERQRMILNQYEMLEERGGSSAGTGRMYASRGSGKGTIFEADEAREKMDREGGSMGLALQSYAMRLRNLDRFAGQIRAMQSRILGGEFATPEEAVAAMLSGVGSGLASPAFQAELRKVAMGTWSTRDGYERTRQEEDELQDARSQLGMAEIVNEVGGVVQSSSEVSYDQHRAEADKRIKQRADAAWERVVVFKEGAKTLIDRSQRYLSKGDAHMMEAARLHAEAEVSLANALRYASDVDTERYAVLERSVGVIHDKVGAVEEKLRENDALAAQLDAYQSSLRDAIHDSRQDNQDFTPERTEIPAPSEQLGGQVEHYEAGKVTLSGKLPPPLTFMKLFGGFQYHLGWIQKLNGDEWTKFETGHFWGFKIDLWLFEIAITMKGVCTYMVRGLHDPVTAREKGSAEKANYENALEIGAKNYGPDLKGAFDSARSRALARVYQPLRTQAVKAAAGGPGARADFDQQADESAALIREIQGAEWATGLRGKVFSIFASVGNIFQSLSTANNLTDGDDLAQAILDLKALDDDALPGAVDASRDEFTDNHDHASSKTQDAFDQINFAKNDPDVSFKSSESTEVTAKVGTSSYNASVSYGTTTTRSDGSGESFDFSEKESQFFTGGISAGKVKGTYKATASEDGSASAAYDFRFKGHVDAAQEEKLLKDFQKHATDRSLLGSSFTEMMQLFGEIRTSSLMEYINDFITSGVKPTSGQDWVLVGLKLERTKDGKIKASASLGYELVISREANFSIVSGSAEHRSGQKVTISWTF